MLEPGECIQAFTHENIPVYALDSVSTKPLNILIEPHKVLHKLAISLCSFSQFFPPNFQTVYVLVLKFGTCPLNHLLSNTFLAIFIFQSRIIYQFVPKNGPNLTCGRVFNHNFISKSN